MRKAITTAVVIAIALAGLWWWLATPPGGAGPDQQSSTTASDKGAELPEPDDDKPVGSPPSGQLPAVREVPIDGHPTVNDQQQAQDLVDQQELGLGTDSRLEISTHTSDDYGNSYYQIEQTYRDLPVFGSQALLEVAQGQAQVLNGIWVEQIDLEIQPSHGAAEALRLALDDRGVPSERAVSVLGAPELLVFVTDQGPTLSWRMTAMLSNPESSLQRYVVDAHTPTIYLQEPVLQR